MPAILHPKRPVGMIGSLLALALASAVAQTAAPCNDHQNMIDQLGIKQLRPGANPNQQDTFNEATANPYTTSLPDVLTMKDGTKVARLEQWPYGYASWRVNLTPHLVPGGENQLAIRLDNPLDAARWYPGGGIYRNVWLPKSHPIHVRPWQWASSEAKIAGAPAKLHLQPDRKEIRADDSDLSFVTVTVTDKAGLIVPRADDRLHFTTTGPGEIIATGSGDPTSFVPFQSHDRAAFNGPCPVIVRGQAGQAGKISLHAASQGLKSASTSIAARANSKGVQTP